ncbi:MAG: hypothetical protein V4510_00075 [bacterium]
MSVEVDRKLLKWGNGYGIRLTSSEVAKLGLHAGAAVHAKVDLPAAIRNDFSKAVLFHTRKRYSVRRILEEDFGGDR